MPVLKYLDTATGTYKPLVVPMGDGGENEVYVNTLPPTPVNNLPELWLDLSEAGMSGLPVSGVMGENLNGNAPLDLFGTVNEDAGNYGLPIYVDKNGLLRGQPMIVSGPNVNMLATDLITRYPLGASVMGLSTVQATSGGWPMSITSIVLTSKRDDLTGNQIWIRNTKTASTYNMMFRAGDGAGWGPWMQIGGLYSGLAKCQTNTTLDSTAVIDITGASLTVPVVSTDSVYMVNCSWDVTMLVQTATAFLGRLSAGGADQAQAQAVWVPGTTAPVNCRQVLSQIFRITGLAAGNQVFKLTASSSTANLYRVSASHSNIAVTQVA